MKKALIGLIPLLFALVSCRTGDITSSESSGSDSSDSVTSSTTSSENSGSSEENPGSSEERPSEDDDGPIPLSFKFATIGEEAVLTRVRGSDTEITIPATYEGKPVTRIGEDAFDGLTKLRKVVIPENVREIGVNAFNSLTNLDDITFPSSLRVIKNYAFANIPYIETVTLPEGLEEIGSSVFSSCKSLKNISLPSSLKKIEGNVFSGDTMLKTTTYEGVEYLGNTNNLYLFAYALNEKNISPTSVTFHTDTKLIGGSLLEGENSVTSITLNEGLTFIGAGAFRETSITEITIPSSVKEIATDAFTGCTKLVTCTINGNSLETIGNQAFSGASALTTINIPSSVKEIGSYAFSKFDEASSLQYNVKDGGRYLGNSENPYYAFIELEDKSATTFSLNPNTVLMAGQCLRDANNIATFSIPTSVKYIGESAFFQMSSLTSIVVPETVLSMGSDLFGTCGKLTSITLNNHPTELGSGFADSCPKLASLNIPSSVKKIGGRFITRNEAMQSLVISSSVLEIQKGAIDDAKKLSVFIEAESDLAFYEDGWCSGVAKRYYGGQWEYKNGVPSPKQ